MSSERRRVWEALVAEEALVRVCGGGRGREGGGGGGGDLRGGLQEQERVRLYAQGMIFLLV